VPDGGSDIPLVYGRRLYTLSQDVTPRGVHYARETVNALLASDECGLTSARQASVMLMHTGSTRILDGLCQLFGLSNKSATVASSYRVLRDHRACASPPTAFRHRSPTGMHRRPAQGHGQAVDPSRVTRPQVKRVV
jgi:hypothetical protein